VAASKSVALEVEVQGVAEAFKVLSKVDPELRKAVIKDMKVAAKPLEAAARALIPDRSPLRNWGQWERNHRGGKGPGPWDTAKAKSGVKVAFRSGVPRGSSSDTIPVLTLRQTNGPGAIYDMAGRAKGLGRNSEKAARGAQMIAKLSSDEMASRSLWPAVENNFRYVEAGLIKSVDSMSVELNKMLANKGRR
jgi:hypothetical protein